MTSCSHSNFFRGLCVDCGSEVFLDEQSIKSDYISVLHQDRGLLVKMNEAHDIEIKERNELLKVFHRLNLIIDLDQTILHTTIKPVPNDISPNIKNDIYRMSLEETPGLCYTIKFRPLLTEFLASLSKIYKLHVYTMGSRNYANKITRIIDPKGELFGDRIVSRDDVGGVNLGFDIYTKKDIRRIFPCDDKTVLVVDDRADIWSWSPNLIPIVPYVYFADSVDMNKIHCELSGEGGLSLPISPSVDGDNEKQKKIEKNKEKEGENEKNEKGDYANYSSLPFFQNDNDMELPKIQKILEDIHSTYFELFDAVNTNITTTITVDNVTMEREEKDIPDIKSIILDKKSLVFRGLHFVFSGIVPLNQRPQESDIWKLSQIYGAKCHENIHSTTTHLITDRRDTDKVLIARKRNKNIKIVRSKWIFASIAYWERVKEDKYLVLGSPSLTNGDSNDVVNVENDENEKEEEVDSFDEDDSSDNDKELPRKKRFKEKENCKEKESISSSHSSSSVTSLDDLANDIESFF